MADSPLKPKPAPGECIAGRCLNPQQWLNVHFCPMCKRTIHCLCCETWKTELIENKDYVCLFCDRKDDDAVARTPETGANDDIDFQSLARQKDEEDEADEEEFLSPNHPRKMFMEESYDMTFWKFNCKCFVNGRYDLIYNNRNRTQTNAKHVADIERRPSG